MQNSNNNVPQRRSSRTWTQRVTQMLPGFNHPAQEQQIYNDENAPDNVQLSVVLLGNLKHKDYRNKLASIIQALVDARHSYLDHVDENWQPFLNCLQEAFVFFDEKPPVRDYRENFTIENYRMLFQRESSAYRDDVCRGVKRIRDGMWVNGEEVKFEGYLIDQVNELVSRGESIMDLVYHLENTGVCAHLMNPEDICKPSSQHQRHVSIERFRLALYSFDERYVVFEKNYIEALIAVEKQSRSLVQQVAELIMELAESGEKVNQKLLDQMAELNKKSRDCFNCQYDNRVLRMILNKEYERTVHPKLWYLPKELFEKFDDICKYLRDLLPKILRVHPKLEHNPLVQRLEKFHEVYQRVMQWIVSDNPMTAFCEFLDKNLPDVGLETSVEKCLLIPRAFLIFVWTQRHEIALNSQSSLAKLVHDFHPEMLVQLSTALTSSELEDAPIAVMVEEIITKGVETPERTPVAKSMEAVSVTLQRTNANAWNAFLSVILHEEEDVSEKMARPRLPSV